MSRAGAPATEQWDEGLFRRLFQEAALGMALVDVSGRYLLANDHCLRLLGYSQQELRGLTFRELTHRDDLAASERYYQRLLAGRQSFVQVEKRYIKRDGGFVWLLVKNTMLRDRRGDPQYILTFLQDITQQKLAEEALTESEQRYRTIFETAGTAMVIYRQDTTITLANSEFCKLCGCAKEETEGKRSWTEFIAPNDVERMLGYHRIRRQRPDVTPRSYEAAVIDNSGRPHDVIITVGPIPESNLTVASLLDIAGLKKAEEERALLATAIEQAAEGLMITDNDSVIQYINPAFERMSGFDAAELIGKSIRQLGRDELGMGPPKEMWRVLAKGGAWSGRYANVRKDGRTIEVETTVSPVRAGGGQGVTNYLAQQRDRTKEAQLERQLRQSQKMEAIGTLAGGIAHDFNNILASIIGYAEIALHDYLGPEHQASRLLGQVIKACGRARDLADQILTFSRQTERQLAPVALEAVVDEALKLLRASLPANIVIERQSDGSGGLVVADSTQLHQVILNLGANAAHAMGPKGGTLGVGLARVELDAEQAARLGGLAAGAHMELCLSDSGSGMDEATIERIFEPYFTTKGPGGGTGLGLALVHGIVTGLGGAVRVESALGQGSRFFVYLPLARGHAAGQAAEDGPAPRGRERLMLVDDEAPVAAMAAEMLGNLGYDVRAHTDSRQAAQAIAAGQVDFDLLITDQTMPGLSGLDLARLVKALRPETPVLICSGYADFRGGEEESAEAARLCRLLRKPLTRLELARAVRQALDGREV